jgi:peptidoglycan/xylan/chitin deacetylase (PgdA/CDA1 family)
VGLALVYHAVAEQSGDPRQILPPHGADLFAAQLGHLRRHYQVVPTRELPTAVSRRRRGHRFPVAITFDDDLPSHSAIAAPLLRREGLPATFFLSGASLSQPFAFWWERLQRAVDSGVADASLVPAGAGFGADLDLSRGSDQVRPVAEAVERLPFRERDGLAGALAARVGPDPEDAGMRAAQVRALAEAGFEIGFHTRHHHQLPLLGNSELEDAMVEGRTELASAAGVDATSIGYPHGKADGRVASAARAAGFLLGFTVRRAPVGEDSDPLLLPRIQPTHASLGHFALELVRTLARSPTRDVGSGTPACV